MRLRNFNIFYHEQHEPTRTIRSYQSKSSWCLCGAWFVFFLLFLSLFSCNGVTPEEIPETWQDAWPLYDLYSNDFLMGNIISTGDLNNATRFDYLKRHFNTLTAENQMKPNDIAPSSKPTAGAAWAYRFTNADRIVDAASEAGMSVVGHTLIWHSQTPAWLTSDAATVEANLEKYVTDVVTHFKDKLIVWDVVNEAMRDGLNTSDAANWKTCLRPQSENGWLKIGPEYIEKAFLKARAADPVVKLYYNDFNLNSSSSKYLAVYNMVNDINTRYPDVEGRPLIDGIGMQSHHHTGTDPQTIQVSIDKFRELNVEIAISELDIMAAGSLPGAGTVAWNEVAAQRQAALYAAMFRVFLNNADIIKRVTFWGIDDKTSWRSVNYPTLLDKDYSLKPAFHTVTNPNGF